MIKSNLQTIFNEVSNGNNEAISCGLKDIGENKAQEFRDKFDGVLPVNYHFFGRLQKNKIKYLVGKVYLIHSVDSVELIEEINRQSIAKNTVTNILLDINLREEQKGGFSFEKAEETLKNSKEYLGVKILGFMAMLPNSNDEEILIPLLKKLRAFYDNFKETFGLKYLSVGMSNDYLLAIKYGSKMVRIGTKIFGERY